jgi:hypothetical protein
MFFEVKYYSSLIVRGLKYYFRKNYFEAKKKDKINWDLRLPLFPLEGEFMCELMFLAQNYIGLPHT